MPSPHCLLLVSIIALASGQSSLAGVIEFTDKQAWNTAAGDFTTIDFTGFPDGTFITDQYAHLGVTFHGLHFIFGPTGVAPNDLWGLHGPFGVHMKFEKPMQSIAVEHPSHVFFELYYQGDLVYTSTLFGPVDGVDIGLFAGLTSDTPFDEAKVKQWPLVGTDVGLDDLHFGPPVPAPGVLTVFGLALLFRRRTSGLSQ